MEHHFPQSKQHNTEPLSTGEHAIKINLKAVRKILREYAKFEDDSATLRLRYYW
jgi:hypothetical protein